MQPEKMPGEKSIWPDLCRRSQPEFNYEDMADEH